jgi:hypothetical protein
VSCPQRFDVAPYALGTLDAGEREDIAEHLLGCRECQTVLESVAGLPGLLARIHPEDAAPAHEVPDEAMFARLLARSADAPADVPASSPVPTLRRDARREARRDARHGPRRRLVLAAAATIALAAGGGWALRAVGPDEGTRIVTASSGPVHATVRVTPTPSGTAVRLQLSGVQAEQRCSLVAVDRSGRRTVAATWEAGYSGSATFDGSVPVPVDRLASLRVETDTRTLLTFPLS